MMKHIKKYTDYLNEKESYSYGCVMVYFDVDKWLDITAIIDKKDLSTDGL